MKKIISILLCGFMVFSMIGCDSSTTNKEVDTSRTNDSISIDDNKSKDEESTNKEEEDKLEQEVEKTKIVEDQKKAEEEKLAQETEKARIVEEQKKSEEERIAKEQATQQATQNQQAASTQIETEPTKEQQVYITPTGKKYHSIPKCGGTNSSTVVSLSEAKNRGLTACSKCF